MNATASLNFDHLYRMSDDTGLLEHARGAVARRAHGYCLDDVARGLVVLGREPDPSPAMCELTDRFLGFTAHAQATTGEFHNRLGYDRRWEDAPATGDWWGRALWGLGTVAARAHQPWRREAALSCFDVGATQRSSSPRAMAFAVLGAVEILDHYPDHQGAQGLVKSAIAMAGRPTRDPAWPWPQPRLAYANAVLAEVLIVGGHYGHDDGLVEEGLHLLSWLLEIQNRDGHLSLTPAGGWHPREPRPGFDQQPIEAAALADACARARLVTDDERWSTGVRQAVAWFAGDNDVGVPMSDATTGGGFDGLGRIEASVNQGAESTLALLSTLQHGRDLDG
jgi:hypothetical protein